MVAALTLASCSKKDDEPVLKVKFGDQEFTEFAFRKASTITVGGQQCLQIECHPQDITGVTATSPRTMACPGFRIVVDGTGTGEYSSTGVNSTYELKGSVLYLEYYNNGWITGNNTSTIYGDWWAQNAKVNITEYDAATGTVSLTAEGDMYSAEEAVLQRMGVDAATKKTMTITISNIQMNK